MALQSYLHGNLVRCLNWWLYWPNSQQGCLWNKILVIVVESPEKIVDLLLSSGTFSPRHLGGVSSVLVLWVYITCFLYQFLIVYWLIGSNFWVLNFLFLWAIFNWVFGVWLCLFVQWSNLLIEYEIIHMVFSYLKLWAPKLFVFLLAI